MQNRKIELYTTNILKGLYWHKEELSSGRFDKDEMDRTRKVSVFPKHKRRIHKGFGGAFTESSGYNWSKLSDTKKDEFIKAYFGNDGLSYNWGRTHINSCDFALGNYACVEDAEDTALEGFNADRDDEYIIPLIKAAEAELGKPVKMMLSPWSPPTFMKTNENMNGGGALKKEYYERWAECFAKYVKSYVDKGVVVDCITVQNEPESPSTWDSCLYTADEEATFSVDHLAPAMKKNGLQDIKIYAWDFDKDGFIERVEDYMKNDSFNEVIDGFAVHWYTGDHFEAVKVIADLYPEKEIMFTEGCVEYYKFNARSTTTNAEMYAHDMIGNFNAGVQGHIDWNLLLDAKGGPNHVGNHCEAPIMLNDEENDFVKNGSYYYIGHFSKHIKEGAYNIVSSCYTQDLEVASFENPCGEVVTVILNRTEEQKEVCYFIDGVRYPFVMDAHSIVTLKG